MVFNNLLVFFKNLRFKVLFKHLFHDLIISGEVKLKIMYSIFFLRIEIVDRPKLFIPFLFIL
jgi:hypothetical protein